MNEIKLDRMEITHADPQVMRDLQRVCTVCGSKRRCEHDFAKNPSDPAWFFFFQAEDGIRDLTVTGVQRVLFRSGEERRPLRRLPRGVQERLATRQAVL